ncbi:hypothetical protein K7432_000346, partial [Basidiobolus ranarum]
MKEINCIVIYEISAECKILYASESIIDVTGYTLEELRGKSGFSFMEQTESKNVQGACRHLQKDNIMASVFCTHIQHKTDGLIPIEAVSGQCYDIILAVITRVDKGEPQLKARHAAVKQTYTQDCDGVITAQEGFVQQATDTLEKSLRKPIPVSSREPAACMILNRFSRRLIIEFATQTCESLLGLNPERCVGLSFLNYIDPEQYDFIMDEFQKVISTNSVAQFQCSLVSPQFREPLPVRLAIFCANDGIILNIRLTKYGNFTNDGLIFLKFFSE